MAEHRIKLPDIGDFEKVEIIEVLVKEGDVITPETSLITLESEKATMEIPAEVSGTVSQVLVKTGDKISQGTELVVCQVDESASASPEPAPAPSPAPAPTEPPASASAAAAAPPPPPPPLAPAPSARPATTPAPALAPTNITPTPHSVYASPSTRKLARQLGVDLANVIGTGDKNRILHHDVQNYVRQQLARLQTSPTPPTDLEPPRAIDHSQPSTTNQQTGSTLLAGLEPLGAIDYSQFGEVETEELSKINQLTGVAMSRSAIVAPHVTQFDEADITALETIRKQLNVEYKDEGIKFTFLSFLIKAVVQVLQKMPRFNASLNEGKASLTLKKYYHIGIAVDTPTGLVVPVLRDADKKGLKEIALELIDISTRARNRRLSPKDFQGGCFTISSLGGIGGTSFTPIINLPEVAILGVSRSAMKPHWDGQQFIPRNMLPVCLSYDHRVIDGANGARFTKALAKILATPEEWATKL